MPGPELLIGFGWFLLGRTLGRRLGAAFVDPGRFLREGFDAFRR
jgi:hypothetical protein